MKAFELLYEDFSTDKVSNVKFLATQWADKHVKHIITEASKKLGLPVKEIMNEIQKSVDKIQEYKQIAPLLYATMADNVIENEIFNLVKEHKIKSDTCPKFTRRKFYRLVDYIKAEHDTFFPLKDIVRHQAIREAYIFIPDQVDQYPEYKSVNTAAATQDGVFIFNTEFMQDLIEFAHIKGIQPRSKKYKSNGGEIDDEYEYIEFVIMHEYMHFTQADWDLSSHYNVNATISNWVGDFRNNYTLVKHGLNQLPIGLFSAAINYDKQQTFKQMVDLVVDEFNKLKPQQQQQLEDMMNSAMDDHDHQQEGQESQGDQGGQGGQGGQGKNPPKPGDIVKNKKTGKYGRVEVVGEGKVKVTEISKEEAMKAKKEKQSSK